MAEVGAGVSDGEVELYDDLENPFFPVEQESSTNQVCPSLYSCLYVLN